MAHDLSSPGSLALVRSRIGARIAEIEQRVGRLKPVDICSRMDAIRLLAADHGLAAIEGMADYSAHRAMRSGHREATRTVLEFAPAALDSRCDQDRETILAAIALRLH